MQYILGVDGGGTKTLAAVADQKGRVCGVCQTGASNFQVIGTVRAGIEVKDAVNGAMDAAGIGPDRIVHAAYGISGADRKKDFATVQAYVEPANPAPHYIITNDTTIALRAGTKDGVGVALIAGTGSNAIGFSAGYDLKKVGGLGRLTGDHGSAGDIAEKGVVAAMKCADGRGPKTVLYDLFCEKLGLENLEDIIESFFIDQFHPVRIGDYAPVVFEAANRNDAVALRILRQTGRQVGHDAVTCMRALFDKNDPVPVVLGGSVFQKGENPTLVDTLTTYIQQRFPNAFVVKLKAAPCLGALLWASDSLRGKPTPRTVADKMAASLNRAMKALPVEESDDRG